MNEQQQQPGQDQQQQTVPPVNVQELAQQTAASTVQFMQEQQQHQQPPMSEAQLAEHHAVWDPSEDFANAFATVMTSEEATAEDRKKAFVSMRDGVMKQASRAVELAVEGIRQEFGQQLAPATQFIQQQQAQALWDDFSGSYPQLKDHQELAEAVSANLRAGGYRPQNKAEMFKTIADGVVGLIQRTNPAFKLAEQNQQQQPFGAEMPSMAGVNTNTPAGGVPPASQGDGTGVADVWD